MRILLVEDEHMSVQNAREQFVGHDLLVASTCMEAIEGLMFSYAKDPNYFPEAIVTDVNVPLGETTYDVGKRYAASQLFPAGLVVALHAMKKNLPCAIITDSNSHEDVIGLLLDVMLGGSNSTKRAGLFISTRPGRLANGGKDYAWVVGQIAPNN